MTRRERLLATLQGKPVDRPAVCFYEINGYDEHPNDLDPFNIFSHPSWQALIDLAREKTDRIVMRGVAFKEIAPDPIGHIATDQTTIRNGRRYIRRTVQAGSRILTMETRQDPDINTIWTTEPLLKDVHDLDTFLELPVFGAGETVDATAFLKAESDIGDTGLVMIDTPDPLCLAALLFNMSNYTMIALTEQERFHRLLNRFADVLITKTREVARLLPGRLWRIYGPEFASPPYLPPSLFREYVCRYVQPMIDIIHQSGGYARIHCHGNIRDILSDIVAMGADAVDPIEPPPQGDVELGYVREKYGDRLVLFGNLECADIENLSTPEFEKKIRRALDEGTSGSGRGFVLMPSASPYGRELGDQALENYRAMARILDSSNLEILPSSFF
ncbi:MAG: uroporphyrinogen decarboxylase family protein [Bacteroidales bacterium]